MGKESGFSLLELVIVCAVLAIIAAIAVPNITQANANYKLNAAGHSIAGLLQQARMQAVKTNQPAYAKYDATGMVFVTDDPTAAYTSGNPDVYLPGGFSFQSTPPDSSQLDAYLGGTAQVPASVAFNARGLPCVPNTNPAVCPSTTVGFEWFIQDSRGAWEAVTVTPSGRVKSWRLASMSGGKAVWQ
ncbi:MAG TPA: GspH/FimT family pseudopilin [Candidatus Angelobacter sp.]|nr:GspH/FimT family pseudopilin [Candidatus Angelobacter sp.]